MYKHKNRIERDGPRYKYNTSCNNKKTKKQYLIYFLMFVVVTITW